MDLGLQKEEQQATVVSRISQGKVSFLSGVDDPVSIDSEHSCPSRAGLQEMRQWSPASS